jgi:hypothetical protein
MKAKEKKIYLIIFFRGKVSNFQQEVLGDFFPQLSNNVSESLNAVLQNCYKKGFINKSALAEGLHTVYSDLSGQKVNKRNKFDPSRFTRSKFISVKFTELIINPYNYLYPGYAESCFFEAIFKYSRPNINEFYSNMLPNALYPPQIILPVL